MGFLEKMTILETKLAIKHIRDGLLGWVICTENLFSFIILYVGVNMYMLIVICEFLASYI